MPAKTKVNLSEETTLVNPFQELEDKLLREELLKKAHDCVTRARVQLIIDNSGKGAFFAHLALQLDMVPVFGIGTCATNGQIIIYEPEWVTTLKTEELTGIIVHEVMHCILRHTTRRNGRDPRNWNIAADLAINTLMDEAGYTLPAGGCRVGTAPFDKFPPNLSAEEYYDMLPDDKFPWGLPHPHMSGGAPGGCMDPPDAAQAAQQEAEWEINKQAAESMAKQRGDVPACIKRLIDQVAEAKVDWREQMREFLTKPHPVRNDWGRPNRRFLSHGLYFPTMTGERLGHVVAAIDTSGSVGAEELAEFAGELIGIIGESPVRLSVIWCDCRVNRVDDYEDITKHDLILEPCGGGGTSHVPVFEWVEELEEAPDVVVCLTDMATQFPDHAPESVPVLWVSTTKDAQAPFGTVIYLR